MSLLLPLLACHTLEKLPLSAADTPDAAFVGQGACQGEIYAARSGFAEGPHTLATAHADVFGDAAEPFHEHLGLADDPATTMAFVWRTDTDTLASQVQIGTERTYGTILEGRSFPLGLDPVLGRVHEVHACGLSPGTTYHYRVGGDGHWSADHSFTTGPAPGRDVPVRFAVLGDSRGNPADFTNAMDRIDEQAPDFYMFTGDAIGTGVNQDEWNEWFDVAGRHIAERPIVMIHGNHEFQAQNFFALFAQPGNEQWFTMNYGNALFGVLNDTVALPGDRELQAEWLAAELAASSQPWRFTFHHQPMYSSCTTHGSEMDLRELWAPVMEGGDVAIDFTGHNHNYERSYPLRGGVRETSATGTTYIVSAGTGAPLYGNDRGEPFTAVAEVTDNFTIVEIDGDLLDLQAFDLAGNVIDTLSFQRSADEDTAR